MRPVIGVRAALSIGLLAALACCGGQTSSGEATPGAAGANRCREQSGVPIGEFHRAGQDCQGCHEFAVSGTVFAKDGGNVGVDGVSVVVTDSLGATQVTTTNCVGNFFVRRSAFAPKFPMIVAIHKGPVELVSHEPFWGSCTSCHHGGGGSPGVVTIEADRSAQERQACPVDPRVEDFSCR